MLSVALSSLLLVSNAALSAAVLENGVYMLQNVNSGLFLGIGEGSEGNGANVQLLSQEERHRGEWKVQSIGEDSRFTLKSLGGDGFLNVEGGSMELGANVWLWDNPGVASSQWRLAAVPSGDTTAYTIQNAKNGLVLNVVGGSSEPGANVWVWDNPGSTHSQWELLGEAACHDAMAGEACYVDAMWALEHGIDEKPEWYPGLNENSSFADMQAHLHYCYWNRCPQPCASTSRHGCGMIGRFWSNETCMDVQPGSKCQTEVAWAMQHGIFLHPEWYPELTETSNERQFQARLHLGQMAGMADHNCPEPCCHDSLPGELCHADVMWAMMYGINLDDFSHVYPPFFTNRTGFPEFQAYLHLCYPERCPVPCTDTETQAKASEVTLDCPDLRGSRDQQP